MHCLSSTRFVALCGPLLLSTLTACPGETLDDGGQTGTDGSTSGDGTDSTAVADTGSDTTDATGTDTGEDSLGINLENNHLPCVDVTVQTLADLLPPGTPTPSCVAPESLGDGWIPDGVSFWDDCTVTGMPQLSRGGMHMWMVEVSAGDRSQWVPYCAPVPLPEDEFEVVVDPGDGTNVALEPVVGSFAEGEPLAAGGDLVYRVTDPGFCATGCVYDYGYLLRQGAFADPIDAETVDFGPMGPVDGDIGFSHRVAMSGPPVDEQFVGRPWIANLTMNYCLSPEPDGCDEPMYGGGLNIAVLMLPE